MFHCSQGNLAEEKICPDRDQNSDGELSSYGDSMILSERIFSQSAPGEVSRAYFRMQGTSVSTVSGHVWTCLDMSGHVWTCLDMSRHDTGHASPPGGVHIFARLGSFRNFAPKPCIFSHTIPDWRSTKHASPEVGWVSAFCVKQRVSPPSSQVPNRAAVRSLEVTMCRRCQPG